MLPDIVTLPTGHNIPVDLMEHARYLYLLGGHIHWDETNREDRDQAAYLQRNAIYKEDMPIIADRLFDVLEKPAAVATISRLYAGQGSYPHSVFSGADWPATALLQLGYIADRLTALLAPGFDIDAAWTHIALEAHPVRISLTSWFYTDPRFSTLPLPELPERPNLVELTR